MKQFAAKLVLVPSLAALAACSGEGGSPLVEEYSMQPGKWELRTWMEINGEPGPNPEELVQTRELKPEMAGAPVNQLLFGLFYPGKSPESIVAEGGRISGSFDHPGTAPIQAHTSDVTGTYDTDEFRMVIDLPVMTSGLTQVVEGKLIEPLE